MHFHWIECPGHLCVIFRIWGNLLHDAHVICHHKLLPTSVGHLIQLSHAVVIPRLYKKWFMITQQARLLELLHWHLIQHYNEWSHRYGLWMVLKPHWFKWYCKMWISRGMTKLLFLLKLLFRKTPVQVRWNIETMFLCCWISHDMSFCIAFFILEVVSQFLSDSELNTTWNCKKSCCSQGLWGSGSPWSNDPS